MAAAIRTGRSPANQAFDRFLPKELREVSDRYWTPLPVVRRAAIWLRAARVSTVVDIGSGAGKFCVATALLAPFRLIGLEHRSSLVASARGLAEVFEVDDRVTFVQGEFGVGPTPAGDAYYFFNPFAEYDFGSELYADADVNVTEQSHTRGVIAATQFLSCAPTGTLVITYNGFGGEFPGSYELVREDLTFRRALRLWRKRDLPSTRPRSRLFQTPDICLADEPGV